LGVSSLLNGFKKGKVGFVKCGGKWFCDKQTLEPFVARMKKKKTQQKKILKKVAHLYIEK